MAIHLVNIFYRAVAMTFRGHQPTCASESIGSELLQR
jgi:hypothetical protein